MLRVFACAPLLLALASSAFADRVPSRKTEGMRSPGAREDITVPYLTNGFSTLGVANGVSPIIVQYPGVSHNNDANVRPVYNLIFYGSVKDPNRMFMGAIPRDGNKLRPYR